MVGKQIGVRISDPLGRETDVMENFLREVEWLDLEALIQFL